MELFTSFNGRISRKSFWLGLLGIVVVGVVIGMAILPIVTSGGFGVKLFSFVLSLVLLYPMAAIVVKRLHDRGKPGMPWAAVFLVPGVIYNVLQLFQIGFTTVQIGGHEILVPGTAVYILMLFMMVIALWMLVELGFLRGNPGTNDYGPNPIGEQTMTSRPA